MQILAAVDYNTSRKKNTQLINSEINHSQYENNYAHDINIDKTSFLFKIIGKEKIKVNSRHKYSVIDLNKAKIAAKSEDGIVEAIEFQNKKFAIGVQWHPEDLFETDENMLNIYNFFIDIASDSTLE